MNQPRVAEASRLRLDLSSRSDPTAWGKPLTCLLAELVEETLAQIGVVPEGELQEGARLLQFLHEPQAWEPNQTQLTHTLTGGRSNGGESNSQLRFFVNINRGGQRAFSTGVGSERDVCTLTPWGQRHKIPRETAWRQAAGVLTLAPSPIGSSPPLNAG